MNKTGKYLGVTIADNLTWNAHVDATSKKANNSLAFLRRNLASCPRDIKAQSNKLWYDQSWNMRLRHGTLTPNQTSNSWKPSKGMQQDLRQGTKNHQQPQSDDCRPWMGTSLPTKGQLQTGNGVPHHIWTYRHSSATVSASISIEHSRPHFALHDSLLQDRCLPEFIFPISNQAMEPAAGDYCSCPTGLPLTFNFRKSRLPTFEIWKSH